MSGAAARPTPGSSERRPPWVSPEVASIGAASFFSDAGHEIATAVLPSFLTGVLRGSAATLGLIEGLTKVFYPEASNTVIFIIMAARNRAAGVDTAMMYRQIPPE